MNGVVKKEPVPSPADRSATDDLRADARRNR